MNLVASNISKGLNSWKKLGAKVTYLTSGNKKVPKIRLAGKSDKLIILASGLHLEETSGPILLLEPNLLLHSIKPALEKGIGFLIYPVINQVGLKYSPDQNHHLLRYDENDFNYNDGWGMSGEKKAIEVILVEKDILETKEKYKIIFGVSLHEDSETPKRGYIYTNAIPSKDFRKSLVEKIKSKVDRNILATKDLLLEAGEDEFVGGTFENDFCINEAKDKGSFENWMADDLKIPTVLSEGPFGLDLDTRKKFHLAVIQSITSTL